MHAQLKEPAKFYKAKHMEITLPLGWRGGWKKPKFVGGPFDTAPADSFRVAVRAEFIEPGDADVHLPIKDFSTPDDADAVEDALFEAYAAALKGQPVFVGCMGGMGRTGLFLALLAKTAGIQEPVRWVKQNYNPHAVETNPQAKYVNEFDVSGVRERVLGYAWGARIANPFRA